MWNTYMESGSVVFGTGDNQGIRENKRTNSLLLDCGSSFCSHHILCLPLPIKPKLNLGWTTERGLAEMMADAWRWQSKNLDG